MKNVFIFSLFLAIFTPIVTQPHTGSLTVICGSMCSGKSAMVVEIARRAELANQKTLVLKPAFDNRKMLNLEIDPLTYIPSRNGNWVSCIPIKSAQEILELVNQTNPRIIIIDEVEFFILKLMLFLKSYDHLLNREKKYLSLDLN